MLLTNRLNSALVLLTLLGAVACAEDDAATDDTSALDAGDDTTDDDAGGGASDDDADDDADDDDADDDVSDVDAGGDDDVTDVDAGGDDDVTDVDAGDDDVTGDDDVDAGDDDVDAGDDDVDVDAGDDDVVGDDDVDAGDDDVTETTDAGSDAGLPDNGGVCESDADCNEGATCFEGVCLQSGTGLRLTLTWSTLADLDIHVITPSGVEVYWGAPVGGGGFLDVDDCAYDANLDTFACIDPSGTHVESIFFETPEAGEYTIGVHGYETGDATIDFTVQPFANDVALDLLYGSVAFDEVATATLEYTP